MRPEIKPLAARRYFQIFSDKVSRISLRQIKSFNAGPSRIPQPGLESHGISCPDQGFFHYTRSYHVFLTIGQKGAITPRFPVSWVDLHVLSPDERLADFCQGSWFRAEVVHNLSYLFLNWKTQFWVLKRLSCLSCFGFNCWLTPANYSEVALEKGGGNLRSSISRNGW